MKLAVVLDSTPLGLIIHPDSSIEAARCLLWLESTIKAGHEVYISGIADYEVRRELIRLKSKTLENLNRLIRQPAGIRYLDINTQVMHRAAELWAEARQMGRPAASRDALDGDMIFCAQAQLLKRPGRKTVVATSNIKHLAQFVNASHWQDIMP